MTQALFLAAAVTLLACSPAPAQQTDAGSPALLTVAGTDVAAQVGDRAITVQELDERWRADNPTQHAEVTQVLYDGRREALDGIIADVLLAEAARAEGTTAAAFEEAEIARRTTPVTDADIVSFYQGNLNQMQGRSLEAVAPAIRQYLQDQQRAGARTALITELRGAGPPVRVMFDPPRREIAVAPTDPVLGSADAPVTLIEFSDFECPFCQRVAPTLKQVHEAYGDRVRIVWKDFPLTQIHPNAFKAAEAAHCAGDQGQYWEYHDRLFANQQALALDDLKRYAADLGLDAAAFNRCVDSSAHGERVRDGVAEGMRLGVNSTPTVYVNGRALAGAQPFETFAAIIDEELERAERR